jgi:hypothetical protein
MSFSRAPVKRFNDDLSSTPAAADYDPKTMDKGGKGNAAVKSSR